MSRPEMPASEPTRTGGSTPTTSSSTAESAGTNEEGLLRAATRLAARVSKRENAREKGLRLLLSGRLRVTRVDGDVIVAQCRGDSGQVYDLGHDPYKAPHWRCTCEARTACSHLHALWAVTAVGR